MSNQPPPMVIYHSPCIDGLCAAWVAKRFLGEVEFVPARYGMEMPNVKDRNVYILDFSFPPDVIREAARKATNLAMLDHHDSALKMWGGTGEQGSNYRVFFSMDQSGAEMAWRYFADPTPPPWWVSYVGDRDRWAWALDNSKEVNNYLATVIESDLNAFDGLYDVSLESAKSTGAIITRALENYERRTISSVQHIWHHDLLFAVGNATPYRVSELSHLVLNTPISHEKHGEVVPHFTLMWCHDPRRDAVNVSLRSHEQDHERFYHVGDLAKRIGEKLTRIHGVPHNGGGHPSAAGFNIMAKHFGYIQHGEWFWHDLLFSE